MRVFISHSSTDFEKASSICTRLEADGYDCFIAPRNIRSGFSYAEELINGIETSDIILLLLSEKANQSPHVLREVECAVRRNMPIVVYKMEEVTPTKSLEYFLMTHQWIDVNSGEGYEMIESAIAAFANAGQVPNESKSGTDSLTATVITPEKVKSTKSLVPLFIVLGAVLITVGLMILLFTGGYGDNSSGTASSMETVTPSVSPGDSITMGTYLGEPIVWRVVKIAEDGKSAVVLSDSILTMKAYDCAEGGKYNNGSMDNWRLSAAEIPDDQQTALRGNNSWELSNIRTWLNSDKEVVQYSDTAPTSSAMSENRNGYHTEAGFLKNFTVDELAKIMDTTLTTNGVQTTDKVFLLSSDELQWLSTADVSIYAKPTEQALAQDESNWYEVNVDGYNVKDHYWWLRDNNGATKCEANVVNISYYHNKQITSESVGLEGFGIRPAMTINIAE